MNANDQNIYGLPNTGPGGDSSPEPVNHTTENGHDIHLPPSNIAIYRYFNANEDAPSTVALDHHTSTPQPPTPTELTIPKGRSITNEHISANKAVYLSLDIETEGDDCGIL